MTTFQYYQAFDPFTFDDLAFVEIDWSEWDNDDAPSSRIIVRKDGGSFTYHGAFAFDSRGFPQGEVDRVDVRDANGDLLARVSDTSLRIEEVNDTGGLSGFIEAMTDFVAGSEVQIGSAGVDVINGYLGNDTLRGEAGDDSVNGAQGDDRVLGGAGNDSLAGESGSDTLFGGDGADTLLGDEGSDSLMGDAGDDELNGWTGDDSLFGGSGTDTLNGGEGADSLYGQNGNDELNGWDGADILGGGLGDDELWGGRGVDRLFGDDGADQLHGSYGDDILNGGAGLDEALYDYRSHGFSIEFREDHVKVVDRQAGREGTDTLRNIESVRFESQNADGEWILDRTIDLEALTGIAEISAGQVEFLTELYIAYFNRAPDAEGLYYWGTRLADGMQISAIAESFFVQDETVALYPDPADNEGLVDAVYQNVLERDGDPAGRAYWIGELDGGLVTRGEFILAVLNGAKNFDKPDATQEELDLAAADRLTLGQKTDIGLYYSAINGLGDPGGDALEAMGAYDRENPTASLVEAKDLIDGFAEGGGLRMQLVGIVDDPFAVA